MALNQALVRLKEFGRSAGMKRPRSSSAQHDVVEKALNSRSYRKSCAHRSVPGVAKTLLVRTLRMCSAAEFARAFSSRPDLMPADITGTTIFNLQRNSFRWSGADLHVVLIADETIVRRRKTQSALLAGHAERRVRSTATRTRFAELHGVRDAKPIEYEGTYPLPESAEKIASCSDHE